MTDMQPEADPVEADLAVLYADRDRLAFVEPKTPAIERAVREHRERLVPLIVRLEGMR